MNNRKLNAIVVIIVVVVFLTGGFILNKYLGDTQNNSNFPDYSVQNTGDKGSSLLIDALKESGFLVQKDAAPFENESNERPLILFAQNKTFAEFNDYYQPLLSAVSHGARLILLTNQADFITGSFSDTLREPLWERSFDVTFKEDETENSNHRSYLGRVETRTHRLYSVGRGYILISPIDTVQNSVLKSQPQVAYPVVEALNLWQLNEIAYQDQLIINNVVEQSQYPWRDLPARYKVAVIQFLIAVILLFYYYGKRFGKPVPFYEETQREQNEYLLTVSDLYIQAGFAGIIYDNYFSSLCRALETYSRAVPGSINADNFIQTWQELRLDSMDQAQKLISGGAKHSIKRRKGRRKLIKALRRIFRLKKIINEERYHEHNGK